MANLKEFDSYKFSNHFNDLNKVFLGNFWPGKCFLEVSVINSLSTQNQKRFL